MVVYGLLYNDYCIRDFGWLLGYISYILFGFQWVMGAERGVGFG